MRSKPWIVFFTVRDKAGEPMRRARLVVIADCTDEAYDEGRRECEDRFAEVGFPISAEPYLRAG